MRVLITNLFLANNSGSEVVVELLADGLRRAGHQPMILSPVLGPQADRMRTRGHIIVDRVAALPAAPDVIHAQHVTVALSALAAFPETPAVFACHSANFEVEAPRPHPQIRRWIAVDDLCRDRCLSRGIPPDRLTVILNAVDLERFARRPPLPLRPRRALLLTKNEGHAEAIRVACANQDVELVTLGPAFGRVDHQIERELLNHDLVFATARMALEAAAIGCAVVVCDGRGFAGLLTAERLSEWRRLNFGARLLALPTTHQLVAEAIAAYDAQDASRVTDRLRAEASLTDSIAQHVAVYETAISDPKPNPEDVAAATASWIEELAPMSRGRGWEIIAREQFGLEAETMTAAIADSERRLAQEMARLTDQGVQGISRELGDLPGRLTPEFQKLADASREVSQNVLREMSREREVLRESAAETNRRLTDIVARIEDGKQGILSRLDNPPSKPLVGKLWRTIVPHAIRAPLFRLRKRLLGRKVL